jgi:hypothetical protein
LWTSCPCGDPRVWRSADEFGDEKKAEDDAIS